MKTPRHTKLMLAGIVLLAIAARATVAVATRSWAIPDTDGNWGFGYEMGRIAGSIAAGDGFSYPTAPPEPTAWMAPVYPMFIAGVFRLFGPFTSDSAVAILSLQVIASGMSCLLVFMLANKLYGPKVGLISAFLLAVYPASVHFSAQKIWSSSFFSAILLVCLLLSTAQARKPSLTGSLLLGFTLGVGTLLDPLLVSIVLPLGLWLCLEWRKRYDPVGPKLAAMLVAFSLVLAPWIARNHSVFGKFVLVKSNVGHELLVGNHPGSNGMLPAEMAGIERRLRGSKFPVPGLGMTEKQIRLLENLNEAEKNQVFARMALGFIANDPARFFRLTASRMFRFWTVLRPPRHLLELISVSTYLAVLSLSLVGLVLARRRGLPVGVLAIPLLCLPIAHYLTIVGLHRYRFPLEPILIIPAALALSSLTRFLKKADHDRKRYRNTEKDTGPAEDQRPPI